MFRAAKMAALKSQSEVRSHAQVRVCQWIPGIKGPLRVNRLRPASSWAAIHLWSFVSRSEGVR